MKKNLIICILIVGFFFSCTPKFGCGPKQGSKDWALLAAPQRTMLGYKHVFVSGADTQIKYLPNKLSAGCYQICEN